MIVGRWQLLVVKHCVLVVKTFTKDTIYAMSSRLVSSRDARMRKHTRVKYIAPRLPISHRGGIYEFSARWY